MIVTRVDWQPARSAPDATMVTIGAPCCQCGQQPTDRRDDHRTRTVYRVARVDLGSDRGFARVRNMSDGGMKLSLNRPVALGDAVRVALTDDVELAGRVVWANGADCGLRFDEPVDSGAVLRATAQQLRASDQRSPRLPVDARATVVSDQGTSAVAIHDVSLSGLKLGHDGGFMPGLPVAVRFESGATRRGVVRWTKDRVAGVMLTEPFRVEELGSIETL